MRQNQRIGLYANKKKPVAAIRKENEMKKVILYGIRGIGRKEIEFFLSNSYEIIGYSDSDKCYNKCRYINYIRYF